MITSLLEPGIVSTTTIDQLAPDRLVGLILSADLPLLETEISDRATWNDRATLERLAWLAQRSRADPADCQQFDEMRREQRSARH